MHRLFIVSSHRIHIWQFLPGVEVVGSERPFDVGSRSIFAPNHANRMRLCRTNSTPGAVTNEFKLVFGGRKGDSQPQRGCDAKPKVAARRLPWVVVRKTPQPQGGCGNLSPRVARAFGHNPVGVVAKGACDARREVAATTDRKSTRL